MELTLDLSPMLVNRTAAFHICRSVIEALADYSPELQYFGERSAMPPAPEAAERLKGKLGRMLDLAAGPSDLKASGSRPSAISGRRSVFLDPLYVLFSELSEEDVVLILDLSPVTTPIWHSERVGRLYEAAFRNIASVAPRLLTISENSAQTYYANYGYTRRPIEIVHLFVPEHVHHVTNSLHAPRPYFLFVGSLEARKNVVGAIEAFRLSGLAEQGYDMLIVGGHGHGAEPAVRLGRATPGVVFCGFVDDAEIGAFYAGATGFVYPSYLEGFGVPLLEALMHGVPAVASTTGACPEVGGDLVNYRDPDDHVGLAQDICRIAHMNSAERMDFAALAKRRVEQQFSLARFQSRFRQAVLAA